MNDWLKNVRRMRDDFARMSQEAARQQFEEIDVEIMSGPSRRRRMRDRLEDMHDEAMGVRGRRWGDERREAKKRREEHERAKPILESILRDCGELAQISTHDAAAMAVSLEKAKLDPARVVWANWEKVS